MPTSTVHAAYAAVLALPAFAGMQPPVLHLQPREEGMPWGEADRDEYAVYLYGVTSDDLLTDEQMLTLVHELVHLRDDRTWHHYAPFRRLVAQAALELWGVDCRHLAGRSSVNCVERAILRCRWWRTSVPGRIWAWLTH